jgi:hypothetical protein
MNKKTLFYTLLAVILVLPIAASAQVTIPGIVNNIASVIWNVAIVAVVIFWLITGVLFVTAMGDPGRVGTAKKALFAAVGGTVIVILAYSAMNIISNAVLGGK